jgi:carboxymethylenebutenolidase
MSDFIHIDAADGRFEAYRVLPETTPAPAVVVLQEIFGINADMKQTCGWLASQGFIAVCPDLFWRAAPGLSLSSWSEPEWKRGFELYSAYDRDLGVADVQLTLDACRRMPECSGKVAVMGFCLGGLMTFLTAARGKPDAAVAYYGGDTDRYVGESGNIGTPMLMHLGEEDEFISKAAQQTIRSAVAANPSVRVYSYPGCYHAFARNTGTHYDPGAAHTANARTVEFFRDHLG